MSSQQPQPTDAKETLLHHYITKGFTCTSLPPSHFPPPPSAFPFPSVETYLESLINEADPLADAVIERRKNSIPDSPPASAPNDKQNKNDNNNKKKKKDLRPTSALTEVLPHQIESLAKDLESSDDDLKWVDWESVKRGQSLYWRNTGLMGLALTNVSLAGGYGVPRVDTLLSFTGKLSSTTKAAKRLLETGLYMIDWVSFDGLKVGGVGWKAAVNVRLIHAAVRSRVWARIRRLQEEEKNKKKEEDEEKKMGVVDDMFTHPNFTPINQTDMLTTLLAFSTVSLLSLKRLGMKTTPQEEEDWMHLWRLVGHLLGVRKEVNPCQWGFESSVHIVHAFSWMYSLHSPGVLSKHVLKEKWNVGGGCPHFAGESSSTLNQEKDEKDTKLTITESELTASCPHLSSLSTSPTLTAAHLQTPPLTTHLKNASHLSLSTLQAHATYIFPIPLSWHVAVSRYVLGPTISDSLLLPEVTQKDERRMLKLVKVLISMGKWMEGKEGMQRRMRGFLVGVVERKFGVVERDEERERKKKKKKGNA
ncbi:hypothetical protein HDV05_003507 [Chytridiales sp. JEL 0842]|nr:hypothetical protein HDV05_003507 [Chytridiales sp. JEL 0842]